jgi:hypothetical protein
MPHRTPPKKSPKKSPPKKSTPRKSPRAKPSPLGRQRVSPRRALGSAEAPALQAKPRALEAKPKGKVPKRPKAARSSLPGDQLASELAAAQAGGLLGRKRRAAGQERRKLQRFLEGRRLIPSGIPSPLKPRLDRRNWAELKKLAAAARARGR